MNETKEGYEFEEENGWISHESLPYLWPFFAGSAIATLDARLRSGAGIYETSTDGSDHSRLPHSLHIEHWQEHLNMRTPEGAAELWDIVASEVHSLPPKGAARGRTLSTSYRHPERPRR